MALSNALIAVATAALVLGLWSLGAGGWSFWGLLLLLAVMSGSTKS